MKTLKNIIDEVGSDTITQVYHDGWRTVELPVNSDCINVLKVVGVSQVCIYGHDYGINELFGLPDDEFARINPED